eukprot:Nk52_evm73s230 gene=Nk52_evmTU73s230
MKEIWKKIKDQRHDLFNAPPELILCVNDLFNVLKSSSRLISLEKDSMKKLILLGHYCNAWFGLKAAEAPKRNQNVHLWIVGLLLQQGEEFAYSTWKKGKSEKENIKVNNTLALQWLNMKSSMYNNIRDYAELARLPTTLEFFVFKVSFCSMLPWNVDESVFGSKPPSLIPLFQLLVHIVESLLANNEPALTRRCFLFLFGKRVSQENYRFIADMICKCNLNDHYRCLVISSSVLNLKDSWQVKGLGEQKSLEFGKGTELLNFLVKIFRMVSCKFSECLILSLPMIFSELWGTCSSSQKKQMFEFIHQLAQILSQRSFDNSMKKLLGPCLFNIVICGLHEKEKVIMNRSLSVAMFLVNNASLKKEQLCMLLCLCIRKLNFNWGWKARGRSLDIIGAIIQSSIVTAQLPDKIMGEYREREESSVNDPYDIVKMNSNNIFKESFAKKNVPVHSFRIDDGYDLAKEIYEVVIPTLYKLMRHIPKVFSAKEDANVFFVALEEFFNGKSRNHKVHFVLEDINLSYFLACLPLDCPRFLNIGSNFLVQYVQWIWNCKRLGLVECLCPLVIETMDEYPSTLGKLQLIIKNVFQAMRKEYASQLRQILLQSLNIVFTAKAKCPALSARDPKLGALAFLCSAILDTTASSSGSIPFDIPFFSATFWEKMSDCLSCTTIFYCIQVYAKVSLLCSLPIELQFPQLFTPNTFAALIIKSPSLLKSLMQVLFAQKKETVFASHPSSGISGFILHVLDIIETRWFTFNEVKDLAILLLLLSEVLSHEIGLVQENARIESAATKDNSDLLLSTVTEKRFGELFRQGNISRYVPFIERILSRDIEEEGLKPIVSACMSLAAQFPSVGDLYFSTFGKADRHLDVNIEMVFMAECLPRLKGGRYRTAAVKEAVDLIKSSKNEIALVNGLYTLHILNSMKWINSSVYIILNLAITCIQCKGSFGKALGEHVIERLFATHPTKHSQIISRLEEEAQDTVEGGAIIESILGKFSKPTTSKSARSKQ